MIASMGRVLGLLDRLSAWSSVLVPNRFGMKQSAISGFDVMSRDVSDHIGLQEVLCSASIPALQSSDSDKKKQPTGPEHHWHFWQSREHNKVVQAWARQYAALLADVT